MDQATASDSTLVVPGSGPDDEPEKRDRLGHRRTAIWAVLSLVFLTFLAFGSVDARIWRFGQLHVESKSIFRMWQVQGRSLPDVSNGWMLQVLFHGSAIVFIVCVILGMRYLLLDAAEEAPAAPEQL